MKYDKLINYKQNKLNSERHFSKFTNNSKSILNNSNSIQGITHSNSVINIHKQNQVLKRYK